jgi:hypothetical protein
MGSSNQKKTPSYLIAVIAVLALSACGEKKSARGSLPPVQPPAPTATGGEPTPTGGGLELPEPQAPGKSPTPSPGHTDPNVPIPAPSPGHTDPNVPIPAPSKGQPKDSLYQDSGYDPVDPKAVEKADFQKRYTGMTDEDGLLYTGSSTDYLLTYLRLRNEDTNLDAGVKARNLQAAQSIEMARLSRDKGTGEVLVYLKVREGSKVRNYVLAGGLSDGDILSSLRLVKGGSGGVRTTGAQHIEGKIKCMDSDGGCETTVARLVIGEPGSRAAVAIVFRESLADIYFSLSASTGNPEYETMRKFWIHSNDEANTDLRLKEVVLKSFEIVNGRSGFDAQIKSYGRQLMSFGGPLLAPEAGTSVSITADRNAQMKESIDLDRIANYKFDLANFIGSAKIVNNNGLGQVRLAVKMRKRTGYNQEAFTLTVMRIIKPTLTPNQENLKLN